MEISGIAGLISTLLCWIIFIHCLSHYTDLICLILDLDIRSLLLAIAPPFVAGFVQVNRTHASAVTPSVQNLYHAALAENLVDSPWSLSSLEPTAGSSTPGQHQRYDNTGGSNNSSELEVSRGIFASIWRHSANSLTTGTSGLKTAKTSTIHAPSKPKNSRTISYRTSTVVLTRVNKTSTRNTTLTSMTVRSSSPAPYGKSRTDFNQLLQCQ